jgi:hypothetical protein
MAKNKKNTAAAPSAAKKVLARKLVADVRRLKDVSARDVAAPVAVSRRARITAPRIQHHKDGMTVTHTEYVDDILGNAIDTGVPVFTAARMGLNPGNQSLCPWLGSEAPCWTKFSWEKLSFDIVSTVGSDTMGRFYACALPDPLEPTPTNKSEMMNFAGATSTAVWSSMTFEVPQDILTQPPAEHYINSNVEEVDARFEDIGAVILAVDGVPEAYEGLPIGELYMSYTVHFSIAKQPDVATGNFISTTSPTVLDCLVGAELEFQSNRFSFGKENLLNTLIIERPGVYLASIWASASSFTGTVQFKVGAGYSGKGSTDNVAVSWGGSTQTAFQMVTALDRCEYTMFCAGASGTMGVDIWLTEYRTEVKPVSLPLAGARIRKQISRSHKFKTMRSQKLALCSPSCGDSIHCGAPAHHVLPHSDGTYGPDGDADWSDVGGEGGDGSRRHKSKGKGESEGEIIEDIGEIVAEILPMMLVSGKPAPPTLTYPKVCACGRC